MYNGEKIRKLVRFIESYDGIADKDMLSRKVQAEFDLSKNRSVFFCEDFAVRFCQSNNFTFSNTVLALATLKNYDANPFIVCLVTPEKNFLMLANATFLYRISHSSKNLRVDNIKGSFNGSDIMKSFGNKMNEPRNFEYLFECHERRTFSENLKRLVKATKNIQAKNKKIIFDKAQKDCILRSVKRAENFMNSDEYDELNEDLSRRVEKVSDEIVIAAKNIDNVNLRGRVIEYLITSEDGDNLRHELIDALRTGNVMPKIFTDDDLGDYKRRIGEFNTATDIKFKILYRSSNPKGYNIDKMLSFLATEDSVYLIYFVGVDEDGKIFTRLCSIFNRQILDGTITVHHLSGINSRGTTEYSDKKIKAVLFDFDDLIETDIAKAHLKTLIKSPNPLF